MLNRVLAGLRWLFGDVPDTPLQIETPFQRSFRTGVKATQTADIWVQALLDRADFLADRDFWMFRSFAEEMTAIGVESECIIGPMGGHRTHEVVRPVVVKLGRYSLSVIAVYSPDHPGEPKNLWWYWPVGLERRRSIWSGDPDCTRMYLMEFAEAVGKRNAHPTVPTDHSGLEK